MNRGSKAPRTRRECCRLWDEVDPAHRREWAWQVLHQLGHSRTTFSLGTLADLARISDGEALRLIRQGEERKWIWQPQESIWIGQLATRK